ncbi:drosomycin-like [Drosophila takahashii]|uniref:drosomycin-like n=1 Tax=Drosophila takahashii TaxID=29030 RepID=UPI001CF881FD|nr:drosomycin-like [Drosophila takahashii]
MMQIKVLFSFLAVLMMIALGPNKTEAVDCLSGRFRGSCPVWSNKKCKNTCIREGRRGGHCSPSLKCWCEGC